jgi:hypothetical protein
MLVQARITEPEVVDNRVSQIHREAVDHLLRHCGGLSADEVLVIVCDLET